MNNKEILKQSDNNIVEEEINDFLLAKILYEKFKMQNSVINDIENSASLLIKTQKINDLTNRFNNFEHFYNLNKNVPGQFETELRNSSLSFYETYGSTYETELEKYLYEKNITR